MFKKTINTILLSKLLSCVPNPDYQIPDRVQCNQEEISQRITELCTNNPHTETELILLSDIRRKNGIHYANRYQSIKLKCPTPSPIPLEVSNQDICILKKHPE